MGWKHASIGLILVALAAREAWALDCDGTSGSDHLVFCRSTPSGSDQYQVFSCSTGSNSWTQACNPADQNGKLQTDVNIRGLGGADRLDIIADTREIISAVGACGSLSCFSFGSSAYDGHYITLQGGDGNDVLWSNGAGQEGFYGGYGDDTVWSAGSYAGNLVAGGPGNDCVRDDVGAGDALYGDGAVCPPTICTVTSDPGDDCVVRAQIYWCTTLSCGGGDDTLDSAGGQGCSNADCENSGACPTGKCTWSEPPAE